MGVITSWTNKNHGIHIVETQSDLNRLIEKTSANNYKIKDNVRSLQINYLASGYDMTSFLSGSDTYAILKTNNCSRIVCEGGTFLNFKTTIGYVEVNARYSLLENVWIKGDDTGSATAITKSIHVTALDATLLKCRVSNRKSSANMIGIEIDLAANAEIRPTTQLYGCQVHNLESTADCTGFYRAHLANGCYAYTLTSSGATVIGFNACREGQGNHVFDIDGNVAKGFTACYRVIGCYAETIDSDTSHAFGFDVCQNVIGCKAYDIDSSAGRSMGFFTCNEVVGCTADDIDSAADNAYGFRACTYVSGCLANNIDHSGSVAAKNAYGFEACTEVSACYATDVDTNGAGGVAAGYSGCTYAAAIHTDEAVNPSNDYVDTADEQVTNKNSVGSIFT